MLPLLAIAGVTAAAKLIGGLIQNHKANQIHPVYNPYQISPYAQQQLGLAQQLFNGRMPGANDIYNGIGTSQSNYLNNINTNATDSAQALALGGLSQGMSNDAYNKLGIQEGQYKNQMLGNLDNAYAGMINEGDKQYQDMWNKYQMDQGIKAATKQSAWSNMYSGLSDLGSAAILANGSKSGQTGGYSSGF